MFNVMICDPFQGLVLKKGFKLETHAWLSVRLGE